ncbi:MAG: hypothetical protein M3O71_15395 [Bacteroidota bacterium]|nr:hypothetical protein [Bacteroidota bacterium]
MDFLIYPVHLFTTHPFAFMTVVIVLVFVMAIFTKGPKNKLQRSLYIGLFLFIPINFIFGSAINTNLIYFAGEPGAAAVISSYATSTRYNNHDVVGYHVLIKTKEGSTVQTSFADNDFNVYPSHNGVTYPHEGDRFNVRYLKHFPGSFIIITNDDGPWASGLQCGDWKSRLNEARSKFEFDRGNQKFKTAYIIAIHNYIDKRCYTDSLDLQKYKGDIRAAENINP